VSEDVLIGRGRQIRSIPREEFEKGLAQIPSRMKTRLSFMSRQHHRVRYFVVQELPRIGKPIKPSLISEALKLPLTHVSEILSDLESNLFFLVRNRRGHVSWAFPVTADKTPHRLSFSSGERIYAA
jgi:hypothetical protein